MDFYLCNLRQLIKPNHLYIAVILHYANRTALITKQSDKSITFSFIHLKNNPNEGYYITSLKQL